MDFLNQNSKLNILNVSTFGQFYEQQFTTKKSSASCTHSFLLPEQVLFRISLATKILCIYLILFEDGKNGGKPKKSVAARIASLKCDCFFLKPKLCCLYIVLWAKQNAIAASYTGFQVWLLDLICMDLGFVHQKYNSLLILHDLKVNPYNITRVVE